MSFRRLVLLVIDGWGLAPEDPGNAILLAKTPTMNHLWNSYPHAELEASGLAVGLPEGTMGNSEVGHLTIGIGRTIYQSYERINQAIALQSIKENEVFLEAVKVAKNQKSAVHLIGLLSDGGVHSHQSHLYHLIDLLEEAGVQSYVHAIADGRDVSYNSALTYAKALLQHLVGKKSILSDVVGRYYAMDRDKRWDRTQVAYDMLTQPRTAIEDPLEAITIRFAAKEHDEFLRPIICSNQGTLKSGDVVIFFNFRPDRARQLVLALNDQAPEMQLKRLHLGYFCTMTQYDESFHFPVLFPPEFPQNVFTEIYSQQGLRQIHIAETEKYAHMTYFINGGREDPFPGEERLMVPSVRSVSTYDQAPAMSTREIGKEVIKAMIHGYPLILLNIAAPDMVGHTGNLAATIEAVEVTDEVIGWIWDGCQKYGYTFAITADHGNAEKMLEGNDPHTAHTTNPVPFILTDPEVQLKQGGGLANLAPTLLEYLRLPIPKEMTAKSLLLTS